MILVLLLLLILAGVVLLRVLSEDAAPVETQPVPEETVTSAPSPSAMPTAETDAPAPTESAPTTAPTAVPASSGPKGYTQKSYQLVSDVVYTYAHRQQDGAAEIEELLEQLRAEDPALALLWTRILETWDFVNTRLETHSSLPDGLPEDESLCLVVLGFQLLPDGSMSDELVGRCETALAGAERYPKARIAVTGGGTAMQNRSATEAGKMAEWLIEHGVAEDRILIEDRSLTTADNAVFTASLLRERAPEIRTLAVVSSDYHIPLGWLLFEEAALVQEYETGEKPFTVAACAAYPDPSGTLPESTAAQLAYVWSVADPKY